MGKNYSGFMLPCQPSFSKTIPSATWQVAIQALHALRSSLRKILPTLTWADYRQTRHSVGVL